MEVKEALLKRRSVRKFTDEKVTEAEIDALMHAAMAGPSACNKTPWEFYVVTSEAKVEELKGATMFTKIPAPMAVVVCGDLKKALPMQLAEFWVQDCSAATENILLCATDLGLGACWCGVYPQKKSVANVQRMLELPETVIPLNIIFVGRPAEEPAARDQYDGARVHRI